MERRFVYQAEEADKAVDDALEALRDVLIGSKGFALTAVVNDGENSRVLRAAGGKCSLKQLATLCAETLTFSKKMAARASFVECNCPECRAKAGVNFH